MTFLGSWNTKSIIATSQLELCLVSKNYNKDESPISAKWVIKSGCIYLDRVNKVKKAAPALLDKGYTGLKDIW